MHVLYVHQNFPAQFGHIASALVRRHGFRCTFVSEHGAGDSGSVRRIQNRRRGKVSDRTHFASRQFEEYVWKCDGALQTLREHPEIRPDLVVEHSGLGGTLFLDQIYDCPIVNFFEWYYRECESDADFRGQRDFEGALRDNVRAHIRNAMMLCDLEKCARGLHVRWASTLCEPGRTNIRQRGK